MATTFTLTNGTTLTGITTYAEIPGDRYSIFVPEGHRYVPTADVATITTDPRQTSGAAWYDLPVAASMWASDARDLGNV